MSFIDKAQILVASGKGGAGSVSFRREAMVPRGGPDGGDGGAGASVFFEVDHNLNTLLNFKFKKKFLAPNGIPGRGQKMTGADGEDLIIKVPKGTLIFNTETEKLVVDMAEVSKFKLCQGGRGGKGNTFFKTSVNQAPTHAQPGEDGEEIQLNLELKLLADVGLVGFPNCGKSTLVSCYSAARPKIANYPFTTLTPNLGVVKVDELKNFVMADIPGIIPGAHQGEGLGFEFLSHIERTSVFLHVLDGDPHNQRDPIDDYQKIRFELEEYSKGDRNKFGSLTDRKEIICVNKSDLLSDSQRNELRQRFLDLGQKEICFVSAATRESLDTLKNKIIAEVYS